LIDFSANIEHLGVFAEEEGSQTNGDEQLLRELCSQDRAGSQGHGKYD
jgi:hypothetical protein